MKGRRLINTLIGNYILFVVIIILMVIASALYAVFEMEKSVNRGELPLLSASNIMRNDYKKMETRYVEALEGSVQILDKDGMVVYSKGAFSNTGKKYTPDELYSMLTFDGIDQEYYCTMQPFTAENGSSYYCLVKIPSDKINVTMSFKDAPYEVSQIFIKNTLKGIFFFLLLFLINIFLYSLWTAKRITKPLGMITQGIRRMTEGDLGTRLDFKAESEFGKIRDAFNFMAGKLQSAEEEKEALEESKQRMLVDISHDLKTPITTMQGYARALNEGMVPEEEKRRRYLKLIYDKSIRVTNLIDDLFELAKLDSMDFRLTKASKDFCEFVREIVAEHYEEIEDKGFELDLRIPGKEVVLDLDTREMGRVISNIISNALKYNPAGTKLRVEVFDGENECLLEIGDDGIGIPDKVRDIIFDPFVRADEARRSSGGTGLGLAIARKIVEKHGGSLELKGDLGTEKTVFSIMLKK